MDINQNIDLIVRFLKSIDHHELLNKINKFKKLNIKNMTERQVFNEILNVLYHQEAFRYITNIKTYPMGTKIFRVRKLKGSAIPNENLSVSSDFWNPPEACVCEYGRLNKPHESLLYASPINPYVAIKEMRMKKGDFFALIVYTAKDDIKVNCIGCEYNYNELGIYDKNAILTNELYNSFLRDEFSRDVGYGTEYLYLYMVSEIIAKSYFDLPARECQDAWVYSSVQDKSQYNICFRAEIARELLTLRGAMIVKYEADDADIMAFCIAHDFNPDDIAQYFHIGSNEQQAIFPEIRMQKP